MADKGRIDAFSTLCRHDDGEPGWLLDLHKDGSWRPQDTSLCPAPHLLPCKSPNEDGFCPYASGGPAYGGLVCRYNEAQDRFRMARLPRLKKWEP